MSFPGAFAVSRNNAIRAKKKNFREGQEEEISEEKQQQQWGKEGGGDKAPPLRKAKMSVKLEMTGEHRWEMETETEHETET